MSSASASHAGGGGAREQDEGRIARSWRLTQEAWELIRADRALLVLAVLSGLIGLAGIATILGVSELLRPAHIGREARRALAAVILAYPLTFVSVFLATAVAAAASAALDGRRLSLGEALAVPASRLGQVALWTLLATVVGVLIEQLASRLPLVASLAARLFGLAWSLASLFAIPILATEGCSAPECLKRSARLIKKRWGEGIAGNIIIVAWLIVAAIVVGIVFGIAIGASRNSSGARDTIIAIGALVLLTLIGFAAVLRQTFAVALYRYAQTGAAQGPFSQRELDSPFVGKRGLTRTGDQGRPAAHEAHEQPREPLRPGRVAGVLLLMLVLLVLSFGSPLFILAFLVMCAVGAYRWSRKKGSRRLARVMIWAGVIFFIARLLIPAFLVRTVGVTSRAMEPTIPSGERILFNRLAGIGVGDIVAFHPPVHAKRHLCGTTGRAVKPGGAACATPPVNHAKGAYVRRIVAGPGDEVAIVGGHVIRNGVRERDSYTLVCTSSAQCNFPLRIKIPPGTWYVLGDNRADGEDSRLLGPIPESWILGVAVLRTWPPDKIGGL
jgi:signal peptidase I